jgi:hypothetical protein
MGVGLSFTGIKCRTCPGAFLKLCVARCKTGSICPAKSAPGSVLRPGLGPAPRRTDPPVLGGNSPGRPLQALTVKRYAPRMSASGFAVTSQRCAAGRVIAIPGSTPMADSRAGDLRDRGSWGLGTAVRGGVGARGPKREYRLQAHTYTRARVGGPDARGPRRRVGGPIRQGGNSPGGFLPSANGQALCATADLAELAGVLACWRLSAADPG